MAPRIDDDDIRKALEAADENTEELTGEQIVNRALGREDKD